MGLCGCSMGRTREAEPDPGGAVCSMVARLRKIRRKNALAGGARGKPDTESHDDGDGPGRGASSLKTGGTAATLNRPGALRGEKASRRHWFFREWLSRESRDKKAVVSKIFLPAPKLRTRLRSRGAKSVACDQSAWGRARGCEPLAWRPTGVAFAIGAR